MKARALLPALAFLALLAGPSLGIIVINPDETECQSPPSNGAPWNYVARLENKFGPRASGVYLGNRYVLTANHVDEDINVVHLNGTNYAKDESFKPVILPGDLRVMRILGDPGLPVLPLIGAAESELNKPCTMIGYGAGKGAPIPGQGWEWGDDTTRVKRWATNMAESQYHLDAQSHAPFVSTAFDIAAGPRTGQIAIADSGCGLFENFDGVWKLVGIGDDVEEDNKALFNKGPGAGGDHSWFTPVRDVAAQIRDIVGS